MTSTAEIIIQRDKTFTQRNLDRALSTVVRWSTLGTKLGIPLDKLEQIRQEYHDVDEQKQGLISLILDNYQFDWEDICNALQQMNYTNLARDIRTKYISTSPSEVRISRNLRLSRRTTKAILLILTIVAISGFLLIFKLSLKVNLHVPRCSEMIDQESETILTTQILGRGELKSVKFIIEKMRIDPRECRDIHGYSPLMAAVRENNIAVVKYFVEEWHWNVQCLIDRSEMHEACYRGNMELLEYFMNRNVVQCGKSLTEAAAFGVQTEILKYLLDRGYSFDCKNHWSYMHQASFHGHLSVLKFYKEFVGKDMCSVCVDSYGNTLLHAAAVSRAEAVDGQLAVVKYLINEQHCDKMVRNHAEQLPIDKARQSHNQGIMEYLE